MQTNEGEAQQEVEVAEQEVETLEEATAEVQDTTDWKAKFEEADGKLRRAQTKLDKSKIDKKVEEKIKEKTGDLDEAQLDYLDVKGISEDEDIQIIENIVKKTGMTVRQALKDEYVVGKLEKNRAAREVKDATPSSTKRTGGAQGTDVATALAKFEQTGKLPDDYTLKSQVINAFEQKNTSNKPSWH